MSNLIDQSDGRKFLMAAATMVLISLGAVFAAHSLTFAPQYPTMVGGLLGALAAFSGADVSQKFLMGKHVVAMANKSTPVEDPEDVPTHGAK